MEFIFAAIFFAEFFFARIYFCKLVKIPRKLKNKFPRIFFLALTRDIGHSRFSDNKIYVSESLSPRNKELFRDCLKFKRDHNFNYIWTQSGKIHLRKNKHSPARIISSPKTLQDLSRQVTAK